MYNYKCKKCGANLDPGEHCDCDQESTDKKKGLWYYGHQSPNSINKLRVNNLVQ